MEELKVEYEGKPVSLRFQNPTRKHKQDYLNKVLPMSKEAKKVQEKIDSEDFEPESFFKVQSDLDNLRHALLLDLHDKSILKTLSDFDKIAAKDLERMYAWLNDAFGLSAKKQDF